MLINISIDPNRDIAQYKCALNVSNDGMSHPIMLDCITKAINSSQSFIPQNKRKKHSIGTVFRILNIHFIFQCPIVVTNETSKSAILISSSLLASFLLVDSFSRLENYSFGSLLRSSYFSSPLSDEASNVKFVVNQWPK
jgi:hypothetical protein